MITGVVTPFHQAIIRLIVRGPTGQAQKIDAVIDTGFDGALSLPPADIVALSLPWRRRGRALLADGTTSLFDIYEATVLWDGAPRRVAADAADTDPSTRARRAWRVPAWLREPGRRWGPAAYSARNQAEALQPFSGGLQTGLVPPFGHPG